MSDRWMEQAACRATGPRDDVFFPESKNPILSHAKRVCGACPVRGECLEEALGMTDNPEGVWGGTSVRERRIIRRARAAA